MTQHLGKYRGKVENNQDPNGLGRVQVSVPSVLGDSRDSWAMPCVPYAGDGVGFFAIPPVGTNLWVEFEGGDPSHPIWTGCFWGDGEVPASPALAETKIFKTGVATITLDDTDGAGGITLETTNGMKLKIDSNGIEINNGQGASIKMSGSQISLNEGALEVT